MRILFAVVALVLGLAGCGTFTPVGQIPVSQSLSPAAQAAQTSINEANVLITSTAIVVSQNLDDGIATPAQAKAQVETLRARAADLDRAQKLLDAGDVLGAKDKAELARRLIVSLHKEIAERARRSP